LAFAVRPRQCDDVRSPAESNEPQWRLGARRRAGRRTREIAREAASPPYSRRLARQRAEDESELAATPGEPIKADSIGAAMPTLPSALVAIAVIAVAAALLLGFLNLARPGAGERSQMLMRWRVGLQLLAVAVIVIVLLTRMR
jgi:hypothetical protein